jgi:molybdopterin-binding protein
MGPMVKVRIDCGIRLISVITKRSFDELEIEEGGSVHVYFKASAVHVVRID